MVFEKVTSNFYKLERFAHSVAFFIDFYKTITSAPLNVIEFNLLPRVSYRENNLQRNFYILFPTLAKSIAKVFHSYKNKNRTKPSSV